MEIKLQSEDKFRVDGGYGSLDNFINISKAGYAGISIDLFSSFQYIEIRKKRDRLKLFTFPKKSIKKEFDFGWWEDAEVVFSLNDQCMNEYK